jgi:hypothetical protein
MTPIPSKVLLLLVAIALSIACSKPSAPPVVHSEPGGPVAESYVPTATAVRFDILPVGGSEDTRVWLASFTDEGRTTRFRIELSQQGKFLAETGSDPIPLLDRLKKALAAKRMPQNVKQADTLPFEYEVLGEDQSRSATGTYSSQPKGPWTTMKVVLANGKGEVFLNLNPADHQGEFAAKDARYGDVVLGELSRVF